MDFQNAKLPSLKPLQNSFAVDEIEKDLLNLFIDLFESRLASQVFDVNVLGAAHLGSMELVRKMVNTDGLVLLDGDREEAATRYLYRAWKSRNGQGRGFHFLRTYLQMLYPNASDVEQMAQDKALPYPTKLSPLLRSNSSDHYSTSRVRVMIDATKTTWENIEKMTPVLRSIIPARFLLYFAMLTAWNQKNYIGATMLTGSVGVVYPAAKPPTELYRPVIIGAAMLGVSVNTVYPAAYMPTEWSDGVFVGAALVGISIITIYPKTV